ncbi:MAG: GAF domain-containing sensor histidine kinase [Chloroflexota bacterium]|nr:MAG: GAF domain-containing sensor histidine kinase [Chloroflexota bacterium]
MVILLFVGAIWIWPQNNITFSIVFGVLIAGVVYFIAGRFIQTQTEILTLQRRLVEIETDTSRVNRRADAILQLSLRFVEAENENEVVSSLLEVAVDLVEAVGASVVPLDDRGQPLTAISYGEIPSPLMDSWVEYLASPEIRHRCGVCQKVGSVVHDCPLVELPLFSNQDFPVPTSVYCLHLRRGGREYGILNLYLSGNETLDPGTHEFLQGLLDETSLVLESIRLQNREMLALQQLGQHSGFSNLEQGFIEKVQEALKTDFVVLKYSGAHDAGSKELSTGEISNSQLVFLEGLMEGVLKSGTPIMLGEVDADPDSRRPIHSIIAAPLVLPDEPAFGVIVAGNYGSHKFNNRHLNLLQTLAGQVSLVLRNSELMAEIEFNTIMAERTRLAREIHDGIAQTLGFLKLQSAQMSNLLATNDTEKLQASLATTYKVLSDAYQDVRQAIDGLRISPNGEGLSAWLKETCLEFEENTGLPVELDESSPRESLPPEIQVQLIRIIQEALNNVRKHSDAKRAWVSCRQVGDDLLVEVRDDGKGFSPEEVPSVSRYGLQGMQERSDLIGADFQVISFPGEGTTVRIRLPISVGDQIGA